MTTPISRPSIPNKVADHERRIRKLEFSPGGPGGGTTTGYRIAYGAIYNDGATIEAGSGDWEVTGLTGGTFTITFDPPFDHPPIVHVTANNNNSAPALLGGTGYFAELYVPRTTSVITVKTWEQDGTTENDGGFDFIAIAKVD